jgi:sugar lactone lactonase YvrE
MRSTFALAVVLTGAVAVASAQGPASTHPRGNSRQAWQDPALPGVLAKCKTPPPPFSIPVQTGPAVNAAPPAPVMPPSTAIPGVIGAGQTWKTVWAWEGNNADGIIPGENGTLLFANNDAGNVMRLDPATGLATVIHTDTKTGGAVSRSKNGALFLVSRGLPVGVVQLEPQRRVFANTFRGEPLECVGGVLNDLAADARGGVYFTVSGGGLFYANPRGVVAQYGKDMAGSNGIVLSPDEKILYVTGGPLISAFDVAADGALTNQRAFATLRGGKGGDGATVDSEGRVYASTGSSVDVFSPAAQFLGSIPGPTMLHGVTFGGPDKKTLYAILFYGSWGTPSARNRVLAIPMIAQGYAGRAK